MINPLKSLPWCWLCCWRLNICVPPNSCLKPISQCDDNGRQSLWEVMRSWGYGISALIRDGRASSLTTSAKWRPGEKVVSTSKQALTRHQVCWCLGTWASQPSELRNKGTGYKLPSLWCFLSVTQTDEDTCLSLNLGFHSHLSFPFHHLLQHTAMVKSSAYSEVLGSEKLPIYLVKHFPPGILRPC